MFGCVLSKVVEQCGTLADWAMEAMCGVVLKWWSVLDAHKTRVARDGSTGVVLYGVVAMIAHRGSERGIQGGRGAWKCVNVLVHAGQRTANEGWSVLSGGALLGVCLCCWRSAWFVVHSGVVLFVALDGARMMSVSTQRVTTHENLAQE